jgi:hypothetical protein
LGLLADQLGLTQQQTLRRLLRQRVFLRLAVLHLQQQRAARAALRLLVLDPPNFLAAMEEVVRVAQAVEGAVRLVQAGKAAMVVPAPQAQAAVVVVVPRQVSPEAMVQTELAL